VAKRFATEIRRVGARPALYMVWPAEARAGDFDDVREAWRAAWRREPDLALYSFERRAR